MNHAERNFIINLQFFTILHGYSIDIQSNWRKSEFFTFNNIAENFRLAILQSK